MRKSFAKVSTPMLAGVVKEKDTKNALALIKNYECGGATGIDLHLSCLDEESRKIEKLKYVIDSSKLPILALNYNLSYDKGFYESSEEDRTNLLLDAVKAGAAAVDIQGYTFDLKSKNGFREEFSHLDYSFTKGNPKEIVVDEKIIEKQMEFIEKVHSMGAEVLLSNHPSIPMSCQQVVELALFLEKRNPDIIKIVTITDTEEQMLEAFKTMTVLKKEVKTPVSLHCGGKYGKLTRIVNPILGGFMCFCNYEYTHNSDVNQPLLKDAKDAIDAIKNII